MSTYKFSKNQKFAIWKNLGPLCLWCKEPVSYRDCNIDHIIPEKLEDKPEELKKVKDKYGLAETFDLNSFENWIPIHQHCNQSKLAKVFEGTPVIQELLVKVKAKAEQTKRIFEEWENDKKAIKIENFLETEFKQGNINPQTLNNIFLRLDTKSVPSIGLTASTIENKVIYLPKSEQWTVEETKADHYIVKKGDRIGIAPISSTPDPKFLCTTCKTYGPWDGNECLNCGTFSYD